MQAQALSGSLCSGIACNGFPVALYLFMRVKKFGLCKGALGTEFLGPIRLAGGLIRRGKIELTCQYCSHEWKPSKGDLGFYIYYEGDAR